VADYWRRIRDHERTYETIEQPSFPYIKIINVGERIVVRLLTFLSIRCHLKHRLHGQINNIKGYLQSRIVFFLMNVCPLCFL
jgi:6-phosphofructo-2-kinase / fructose-2,6-biphosphatase 4